MVTSNWKRRTSRTTQGMTLMEMLIVVAILAVLVALAVPTFSNQLERGRESTDLETVRAAYNEVLACARTDDTEAQYNGALIRQSESSYKAVVSPLVQQVNGWTSDMTSEIIGDVRYGDTTHWHEEPEAGGSCTIVIAYDEETDKTETNIYWGTTTLALAPSFDVSGMYQDNGQRASSFNSQDQKDIRANAKQTLLNIDNETRKTSDQMVLQAIADYFVGRNLNTDTELQETLGWTYTHKKNDLTKGAHFLLFEHQTNADGEINIRQLNGVPNFFSAIGYAPKVTISGMGTNLDTFFNWYSNGRTGNNYVNQYLFQSDELIGNKVGNGVTAQIKFRLKISKEGMVEGAAVYAASKGDDFSVVSGTV